MIYNLVRKALYTKFFCHLSTLNCWFLLRRFHLIWQFVTNFYTSKHSFCLFSQGFNLLLGSRFYLRESQVTLNHIFRTNLLRMTYHTHQLNITARFYIYITWSKCAIIKIDDRLLIKSTIPIFHNFLKIISKSKCVHV